MHADAAKQFDGYILEAFRKLMDMPDNMLTPEVVARVRKPLKMGGIGLRSMQSISSIAFVSAAAQAAPLLYTAQTKLDPSSPYTEQVMEHLPTVREAASNDNKPSLPTEEQAGDFQDFLRFYAVQAKLPGTTINTDKLQHRLTKDIEQAASRAYSQKMKEEAMELDQAHLNAVTGKWAASFLTVFPSNQSLLLHDCFFRIAVRSRLLCEPLDSVPRDCLCKQPLLEDQLEFHALNCQHISAKEVTDGHNQVVQVLTHLCHEAGASARASPVSTST